MVLLGLAQVLFVRGRGLEIVFVSSTRSCLGGSATWFACLMFLIAFTRKAANPHPECCIRNIKL